MQKTSATLTLQTVIVKKSYPGVESKRDAAAVAHRHGATKRVAADEKSTSYRFRQRSPRDFVPGSFVTVHHGAHVSTVMGQLRSKARAKQRLILSAAATKAWATTPSSRPKWLAKARKMAEADGGPVRVVGADGFSLATVRG